jgi:hypothetical protein
MQEGDENMVTRMVRALVASAAVALVCSMGEARADNYDLSQPHEVWYQTAPPLFSNYYAQPYAYGGVPAVMYVSPLPTPPVVGHTYVTYQPLMPHEFMYRHHRVYYKWHNRGGNYTRVSAWWW